MWHARLALQGKKVKVRSLVLQGSRMVARMTESDSALMLGGDLLITIFEVGMRAGAAVLPASQCSKVHKHAA